MFLKYLLIREIDCFSSYFWKCSQFISSSSLPLRPPPLFLLVFSSSSSFSIFLFLPPPLPHYPLLHLTLFLLTIFFLVCYLHFCRHIFLLPPYPPFLLFSSIFPSSFPSIFPFSFSFLSALPFFHYFKSPSCILQYLLKLLMYWICA